MHAQGHLLLINTGIEASIFSRDMETAQAQIRHLKLRRLIRVSTVCLHNVLIKFKNGLARLLESSIVA